MDRQQLYLKGLVTALEKIDRHLSAIEREYKKKNIEHRIREDWGYAFYTGKFVAYVSTLRENGFTSLRKAQKRAKRMRL